MIYIAAPFFNATQIELVDSIEQTFDLFDMEYYSPRSEGVLMNMTPEEKKSRMKYIFDKNVEMLNKADTIVAVIDNYDTGTVWEIGYAFAKGKRIITITDNYYGVNVMINECIVAHCTDVAQLPAAVDGSFTGEKTGDVV